MNKIVLLKAIKPKLKGHFTIYILFHPVLLALYTFLTILYFSPDYFQKYTAEIIETNYSGGSRKEFYHDLDGDGINEKIYAGHNLYRKEIRIQHHNLYCKWMLGACSTKKEAKKSLTK